MQPFVEEGRLLERSYEYLSDCLDDFVVITAENRIVACAGLRLYEKEQFGEIYALVVNKAYHNTDISKKLMEKLINKAIQLNLECVFALSKYGGRFFLRHGFVEGVISALPLTRQKSYDHQRKSTIYLKKLPR
ncbi:MAG: GNAT family N-acetyltransferase [Candidatus Thioglobus sp.]|jgi:N-acetylglutamate synthase-like GNAT family acetyltransferase|nr:GNAT family N-acetyltransferase [Candidatus Thioglobus sp.]